MHDVGSHRAVPPQNGYFKDRWAISPSEATQSGRLSAGFEKSAFGGLKNSVRGLWDGVKSPKICPKTPEKMKIFAKIARKKITSMEKNEKKSENLPPKSPLSQKTRTKCSFASDSFCGKMFRRDPNNYKQSAGLPGNKDPTIGAQGPLQG